MTTKWIVLYFAVFMVGREEPMAQGSQYSD
jgi:hypothetical protein